MIEWTRKSYPNGAKRIVRSFCFFPKKCESNRIVWLGWRYKFQSFHSPEYTTQPFWLTHATLSPLQFQQYLDSVTIHMTDPSPEVRAYAQAAKQFSQKNKFLFWNI
jgi:hypothetical protein